METARRTTLRVLVSIISTTLVLSPDLGAQAVGTGSLCELGRVTNIIVDNRPIFQLETLEEGSPLRWVYRLANALHITTRQSFILREVLFSENDCLDPFLLEESGRILRQYPFIANADVVPVEQPDGTYHVLINTQDEWTTKFDLGVSIDQGIQLERIELTEENLFGQGILAEGYFARRRAQRDAGFLLEQPRLFGTRTDARFGYGRTRVGNFFEQELAYPFVGEVGRFAVREAYSNRDRLYTYATGNPTDVTQVLLPLQEEWLEISFATRFGRPGRLGLLGFGLSRDRVEFGSFPTDVEVVLDGDFSNTFPGTDQLQVILASQINGSATTRINLMLGLRQIRYIRPARLDTHAEVIDVPLGIDLGLTVDEVSQRFGSEVSRAMMMFSPAFAYSPDITLVRYSCSLISRVKADIHSEMMDGETSSVQLISTPICVPERHLLTHSSSAHPPRLDGQSKPPSSSH